MRLVILWPFLFTTRLSIYSLLVLIFHSVFAETLCFSARLSSSDIQWYFYVQRLLFVVCPPFEIDFCLLASQLLWTNPIDALRSKLHRLLEFVLSPSRNLSVWDTLDFPHHPLHWSPKLFLSLLRDSFHLSCASLSTICALAAGSPMFHCYSWFLCCEFNQTLVNWRLFLPVPYSYLLSLFTSCYPKYLLIFTLLICPDDLRARSTI